MLFESTVVLSRDGASYTYSIPGLVAYLMYSFLRCKSHCLCREMVTVEEEVVYVDVGEDIFDEQVARHEYGMYYYFEYHKENTE